MLESLLSQDGFLFVLRWLHFFAGIIWIGLLYYFNFVQGAYFTETDAGAKSSAVQKLVPRALWWFRHGALWTFLTGFVILTYKGHAMGPEFMNSSYGLNILTGGILATLMAANVWFVIWPNQRVVIASALQAAQGKPALPEAAACGAKAGLASRTNVLFSIPMLFFMGAASHLPYQVTQPMMYLLPALILMLVLEGNALWGKMGPITTIKGVITSGFILTAVFIGISVITQ
jgi:uncharacterized membrane protein